MYETYLEINGVGTKITSFGRWVQESLEDADLVIIIPGNPGINGFYNTFAKTIYDKLGYSVWILGYAGLNLPKQRTRPVPQLAGNEELYGLKGQLQNKDHEGKDVFFFKVQKLSSKKPSIIKIIILLKYPSTEHNALLCSIQFIKSENLMNVVSQLILAHRIILQTEFFKKYIPKNAKIHLIGHSIGSFLALGLLQEESLNENIVDVYLLFPTIEHMAKTCSGRILINFVKPIVWLIIFLSWIFTMLPDPVQTLLLNTYMKINDISLVEHRSNIRSLIKPGILKGVFFLAFQEMDLVKERDNDVIGRNIEKIKFIYGKTDSWTPRSFYENLKREIPDADVVITEYDHSFVLKQSILVGNLVSNWIRTKNENM